MRGEVLKLLSLKILRSYEEGAALIVVARVLRKFPLNKGGSAERQWSRSARGLSVRLSRTHHDNPRAYGAAPFVKGECCPGLTQ